MLSYNLNDYKSANYYISLSYFGGVCDTCNKEYGIYISRAGFNALRFLSKTSMDKIYRLNIDKNIKKQIEKITTFIINSNYSIII